MTENYKNNSQNKDQTTVDSDPQNYTQDSQESIDTNQTSQSDQVVDHEGHQSDTSTLNGDDQNIDESPVNEPEAKITALEQQVATTKDQLLRALAECENIRKRAERDRQDASQFAISQFARDLLGVADNLNRAIIAMESNAPDEIKPLLDGVEITEKELMKVFEKHKIQKHYPLHVAFDPNFHQAMFEVEHDQHPVGTITEVLQAGYTLNDRLLRPAMVGVAKAKK